jgi:hypothetical protein
MTEDKADDELAERVAEIATRASEQSDREQAPAPYDRRRGLRRVAWNPERVADVARRAGDMTRLAEVTRVAGGATRRAGDSARRAVGGARNAAGWLSAQVLAMAPRIKVRSRDELLARFPDRDTEEIADALVDGAARATAAAGGAAGLAALLPVLPAFPAEVAGETLVVVGVEIKLIAELHEVYGAPAHGSAAQRMTMYVAAWASRRGVSVVPGGILFAAGSPISRLLRRRLAVRAGRSALALGPLLTGAAAGAYLNSRETRRLAQQIRRDLRRGKVS